MGPRSRDKGVSRDAARAAKEKAKRQLARRSEVCGIGITRKGRSYAVKVNLSEAPKTPLPSEIDGVPVVTHEVGKVRKQ